MLFSDWYTDTMDVYRTVKTTVGHITRESREKVNESAIPCRVYNTQLQGGNPQNTAAVDRKTDKLACPVETDIKADDLIIVHRGALVGGNTEERYTAGKPQMFYDPVGMDVTGLSHMEVGLYADNIVN